MTHQVTCKSCGFNYDANSCRVVVIETDTGGTLVSRAINEDSEVFTNRYHSLVDSGRYPNMSNPQIECNYCRNLRYKEIQEELDYWDAKNNQYF